MILGIWFSYMSLVSVVYFGGLGHDPTFSARSY